MDILKKIFFIIFAISANVVFSQKKGTKNPGAADTVKAENTILYEPVDQLPEFPGGMFGFRNKVMSSIDKSIIDGSGKISTEVTFVVEKDGTMRDLKAYGTNASFNKAAIDVLKRIKEK